MPGRAGRRARRAGLRGREHLERRVPGRDGADLIVGRVRADALGPLRPSGATAPIRPSGTPQINHWNGSTWSTSALPSGPCSVFEADCALTGVSGDSASDVIAVGEGTIPTSTGWVTEALAYRWNGTAWSQLTVPGSVTYDELEHVQAFSPTDAWAVGVDSSAATGAAVATALNWNGSAWSQVATPVSTSNDLSINAISGTSASDIWVVGQTVTPGYHNRQFTSVIMHYNGTSWTSQPDPAGVNALTGHAVLSPGDLWFSGYYYPSNAVTAPAVLHTSSG